MEVFWKEYDSQLWFYSSLVTYMLGSRFLWYPCQESEGRGNFAKSSKRGLFLGIPDWVGTEYVTLICFAWIQLFSPFSAICLSSTWVSFSSCYIKQGKTEYPSNYHFCLGPWQVEKYSPPSNKSQSPTVNSISAPQQAGVRVKLPLGPIRLLYAVTKGSALQWRSLPVPGSLPLPCLAGSLESCINGGDRIGPVPLFRVVSFSAR